MAVIDALATSGSISAELEHGLPAAATAARSTINQKTATEAPPPLFRPLSDAPSDHTSRPIPAVTDFLSKQYDGCSFTDHCGSALKAHEQAPPGIANSGIFSLSQTVNSPTPAVSMARQQAQHQLKPAITRKYGGRLRQLIALIICQHTPTLAQQFHARGLRKPSPRSIVNNSSRLARSERSRSDTS